LGQPIAGQLQKAAKKAEKKGGKKERAITPKEKNTM